MTNEPAKDSKMMKELEKNKITNFKYFRGFEGRVFEVSDIQDYLNVVSEVGGTCFRGQDNDEGLVPSIGRFFADLPKKVLPGRMIAIEKSLLSKFKNATTELGLQPQKNVNDWEWLALGQHFGLPTRLLDWSRDPLVALWFAVRKTATRYRVVFCTAPTFDMFVRKIPQVDSPLEVRQTYFFNPQYIAPRLSAQLGLFSVHSYKPEYTNGYINLNYHKDIKRGLTKIVFSNKQVLKIKAQLIEMGLSNGSLFQSMDSVAGDCKEDALKSLDMDKIHTPHEYELTKRAMEYFERATGKWVLRNMSLGGGKYIDGVVQETNKNEYVEIKIISTERNLIDFKKQLKKLSDSFDWPSESIMHVVAVVDTNNFSEKKVESGLLKIAGKISFTLKPVIVAKRKLRNMV